jgi:hypothetical protein
MISFDTSFHCDFDNTDDGSNSMRSYIYISIYFLIAIIFVLPRSIMPASAEDAKNQETPESYGIATILKNKLSTISFDKASVVATKELITTLNNKGETMHARRVAWTLLFHPRGGGRGAGAMALINTYDLYDPQEASALLSIDNDCLRTFFVNLAEGGYFRKYPIAPRMAALLENERYLRRHRHLNIDIRSTMTLGSFALISKLRCYDLREALQHSYDQYIHHADLDIDMTTGLRFHPFEIIVSMAIKLTTVAALGASPLAVLIFEVALNATSMFNHSNIDIPQRVDRILRLLIVTPDMHRVHHSVTGVVDNTLTEMVCKCGQAIPRKDAETPCYGR